jgi:SAM-dependent methyltransferase
MPDENDAIKRNYGQPNLIDALLAALQSAGKNLAALTPDDLAPFDELHIRGREATRELARLADARAGMRVLDAGCGLGGAARTVALEYGCHVAGFDLTENYAQAAKLLTALLHLEDRVIFSVGSAADMPFADAAFDVVWMQHMGMNIADKARLYAESRRVLRPGGRLALYEVCAGANVPPHFPVPWANDESMSFLLRPDALRDLLASLGFREQVWADDSARCIAWYASQRAARTPATPRAIGLDLVLGANVAEKARNALRNLEENRIVVYQAVFEATGGSA